MSSTSWADSGGFQGGRTTFHWAGAASLGKPPVSSCRPEDEKPSVWNTRRDKPEIGLDASPQTSIVDLEYPPMLMITRGKPAAVWIATLAVSNLPPLLAGQLGDLTYAVHPTSITITDCEEDASGALVIPPTIEGKPVTTIGNDAFEFCIDLTALTIPASVTTIGSFAFNSCMGLTAINLPGNVTSIGDSAFQACTSLASITIPSSVTSLGNSTFNGCSGLTSISVDALNSQYSSSGGILFNKAATTLIQCPAAKAGSVTIPDGVTAINALAFESCSSLTGVTFPNGLATIGASSFYGCSGLTTINLPSSVSSIGIWAFQSCTSLTSASFAGNAPTMASGVFDFAAPSFTVYYFMGRTGFTSPTWLGYPAVSVTDPAPIASWLTLHGFPTNTNMGSDPNGDGVSLLEAYAFNLNPHLNLRGSLPVPAIAGAQMSLTFYAGSAGVTYTVQSCTDLQSWSTAVVTVSAPSANQLRTATVPTAAPRRFMRIVLTTN
jgi:hypothetical protein